MNVRTLSTNTRKTSSKLGSLARNPHVSALSLDQRAERERFADYIGDTIKKLEGDHGRQAHRSARFYRLVAFLMDPPLIREALVATQDAIERDRAGESMLRKGPAAYFGGAVLRIAAREGIDLGTGQQGSVARFEALASPEKAHATAGLAATGAEHEAEGSTLEQRARTYADNLFPWKYAHEHGGRRPSEGERQAAYEERLKKLRAEGTTT